MTLKLTALRVDEPTVLQSGALLRAGVHLRWSFRPELGFPRYGFHLFRRPFGQGAWLPLSVVTLPIFLRDDYPAPGRPFADEVEAAIARVAASYDGAFFQHERQRAPELISIVRSLLDGSRTGIPQQDRPLPGSENRRPRLRTIDFLLTASLEPSLARILGVYWIDAEVPPGVPVDYKLIGYWDDPALAASPDRSTSRWPLRPIDLTSVQPAEAATGRITLGAVEIVSARRLIPIDVTVAGTRIRALETSGAATLPLLLSLRQSVREIVLTLPRSTGYGRPNWSAVGWLNDAAVPLTIRSAGDAFVVSGRDGPFQHLSLLEEGSGATRYAISSIACRERSEPLVSLEAIADQATTAWQPVQPPIITGIEPVRARAGEAPPSARESRRSVGLRTAPSGGTRDRYRPIFLRVARAAAGAAAPSDATHDFLTDGPLPAQPCADLVAGWNFDGSVRERVSGATAAMRGGPPAPVPGFRSVAAGSARQALRLDGASCLDVAGGLRAQRLRALIVECWLAPDTIADAVIVDCQDATASFRLSLVPPGGQIRFTARGETGTAEAISRAGVAAGAWTHVAAAYDGAMLRIYLNGRLEAQQVAALGRLVLSPSSRLSIGAEASAGPVATAPRRGFRGALLNLHIWRERTAAATLRTRNLIGAWPLDGGLVGLAGRLTAVAGAPTFDLQHPEQPARRVAVLARDILLESDPLDVPTARRHEIRLQAWIRHDRAAGLATIVGFEHASGPWLGIDPTTHRLKLRLNGNEFVSGGEIPPATWTHVIASYDGREVVFFLNGRFDSAAGARLGAVQLPQPAVVRIGATLTGPGGARAHYFRGMIADVAILGQAVGPRRPALVPRRDLIASWPLDGSLVDAMTGLPLQPIGAPAYASGHPVVPNRSVVRLNGAACLTANGHTELMLPIEALTLSLRLLPAAGQVLAVVIGDGGFTAGVGRTSGYALGLAGESGGYRARLWLNGRAFDSRGLFPADVWSEIVVAYDGQELRFRLNGRTETAQTAALGRLTPAADSALVVGADTGSRAGALVRPYRGSIADIAIWRRALAAEEMAVADIRSGARYDYLDTSVPAGTHSYSYHVQGVDVFGRLSPWSPARRVDVSAPATLAPPQFVRAAFLPGRVTAVTRTAAGVITIATDITAGGAELSAALAGSEAVVSRGRAREVFAITQAEVTGGVLSLRLAPKPLAALEVRAGDMLELGVDSRLQVSWEWSGRSRALMLEAREFRVYLAQGPVNSLRGRVLRVQNRGDGQFTIGASVAFDGGDGALSGRRCMIGSHVYEIASNARITEPDGTRAQTLNVTYRARPVLKPEVNAGVEIPLDRDLVGWRDMREPAGFSRRAATVPVVAAGVVGIGAAEARLLGEADYDRLRGTAAWLPAAHADVSHAIYRLDVAPGDIAAVAPEQFVPGAIVATVPDDGEAEDEQILDVVWSAPRDGGGATLYLRAPRPDATLPPVMRLVDARFLPGQRMQTELYVPPPNATDPATRVFHVGVTVAAAIEGEADLRESRADAMATAIAVDRRRPQVPSDPPVIAAITPADYHGRSRVDIRWAAASGAGANVTYQVLRASDRATFAADLDARRMRTGAYAPARMRSARQVFEADDPDFGAWIVATFPGFRRDWPALLTSPTPAAVSAADQRAWADVLKAWAERFYPAADVQELAGRAGNERAFGLAVQTPVSGLAFTDRINGLTRNRILYRLRTVGGSLTRSELGPASRPTAPPRTTPPQAPRIKQVKPEQASISVEWVLSADTDVRNYRIYRGDSAEELEDLRWFSAGSDPRIIATVPDPRLVASERSVSLAEAIAPAAVRGVFAHADYRRALSAKRNVTTMFNLVQPATTIAASEAWTKVTNLRRVADSCRLVVAVASEDGTLRLIGTGQTASYTDTNLTRPEHWYRIAAVAEGGVAPLGAGPAVPARSLAPARPRPPTIEIARTVGAADTDRIELSTPTGAPLLEARIDLRPLADAAWRPATGWAPMRERTFAHLDVPRAQDVLLRLRVRSIDCRSGIVVEELLSCALG
jgi:hypothetical protein